MANSTANPRLISGEKTVASAGTAAALVSASQKATWLRIIAKAGNTNQVYVGGSDIAATTNDGLDAGEELVIEHTIAFDLADVYLDVDTNGEGVDFYALKA